MGSCARVRSLVLSCDLNALDNASMLILSAVPVQIKATAGLSHVERSLRPLVYDHGAPQGEAY